MINQQDHLATPGASSSTARAVHMYADDGMDYEYEYEKPTDWDADETLREDS